MDWSTPDLCDAHPQVAVAEPLFRDFGGRIAFHGRIATVECFEDNSRVRECVQQAGHGQVLVVDGGGSLRRSLLGDRLAEQAVANGWSGMLINGGVRDVDALARLDLGIKALAATPMKTDRRGLGDTGVALSFAGVRFVPGHWLYADANGVIVSIPHCSTSFDTAIPEQTFPSRLAVNACRRAPMGYCTHPSNARAPWSSAGSNR